MQISGVLIAYVEGFGFESSAMIRLTLVALCLFVPFSVSAQQGPPPIESAPPEPPPPPPPEPPRQYELPPTLTPEDRQPHDASPITQPEEKKGNGVLLDGHVREGAFLAGPGSLPFILHHTLLGLAGGLATMTVATMENGQITLGKLDTRIAMLAGSLVGAGVGFGTAAWWQFNHWLDRPVATYGIINSVVSGMFLAGLLDVVTNDANALTWTAFIGAEIGAWVTATVGGGQMPASKGLLTASGAGWGLIYAALMMGILSTSGTSISSAGVIDTLLIAPGVGALLVTLGGLKYSPTTSQILRADLFGLGAGAGVFFLSALILGSFNYATPYVLGLVASVGAITAVSLLWAEEAERGTALQWSAPPRAYNKVYYW